MTSPLDFRFPGSLNVTGNVYSTGTVSVDDITINQISLTETGGGVDTVTLKAPASIPTSYTLSFPLNDGDSGQLLTTDGSGTLTWTNPGPVAAGGSFGEIQYNNATVFDGVTGTNTDGTDLTVSGIVHVTDTTDSSSVSTGALTTTGGIGIDGNLVSQDVITTETLTTQELNLFNTGGFRTTLKIDSDVSSTSTNLNFDYSNTFNMGIAESLVDNQGFGKYGITGDPRFFIGTATSGSIPNNSQTSVTTFTSLTTMTFDGTNVTIPRNGYYMFDGYIRFTSASTNASSQVNCLILNATSTQTITGNFYATAASTVGVSVPTFNGIMYCSTGDLIRMRCYQNTGGSRTINTAFMHIQELDYTCIWK